MGTEINLTNILQLIDSLSFSTAMLIAIIVLWRQHISDIDKLSQHDRRPPVEPADLG